MHHTWFSMLHLPNMYHSPLSQDTSTLFHYLKRNIWRSPKHWRC
jgi:hypothetical protein